MIYLNQVGPSKVVITLYDNCKNVVNPYFTWKLIDKDSDVITIFTADDYSPVPYYWSAFTFSVSPTPGLTSGIINIPASTFTYEVYEMENPYDLNLNNSLGMVKSGILIIEATFSAPLAYTQSNNTPTPVYRNQNRI